MKRRRIKTRYVILALSVVLALFVFFPRNLARLAETEEAKITSVTLHGIFIPKKEAHIEIELTDGEKEEFLSMLEDTYVFLAPFPAKYSNGGEDYVGYFFELARTEAEEVPPLLHYFTKNTVSVNGISYHLYGNGFAERFAALTAPDRAFSLTEDTQQSG